VEALRQVAVLTLTAFPQTVLPNPMVREMTALARSAEIDVPLVEELAADIFMGTFTGKWVVAARLTAEAMAGTLYARYYDLPAVADLPLPPPPEAAGVRQTGSRARPSSAFADLCAARAAEAAVGDGNQIARNGTVIEQSQILTTHNLSPLVARLDLGDEMARRGADLAVEALAFATRLQTIDHGTWRARLQATKNTAYAWRQAIFFLSFATPGEQEDVVAQLGATAGGSLVPAVEGLDAVVGGARFDRSGRHGRGRRLLGWSVGPHWLLGPAAG
jgi:hypothetical protein